MHPILHMLYRRCSIKLAATIRMISTPQKDAAALRQALAVAVVRSKRSRAKEAAELHAKVQRLESELLHQQAKHAQLQQWASTVLQQQQHAGEDSCQLNVQGNSMQEQQTSVFLPPLATATTGPDSQHLTGHYHSLQQQLTMAAAAAGDVYGSVVEVLEGKSAMLTSMLLTNVQMLQQLQQGSAGLELPGTASIRIGCTGGWTQGRHADAVAGIASFITTTLLYAPNSSLSSAYMRQCAALLAALLAPAGSTPASAAAPAEEECRPQSAQEQQTDLEPSAAVAVQVVQLMQQLLDQKFAHPAAAAPANGSSSGTSGGSVAVKHAAGTMLQQLSTFPGTALLLCLAAAQHLQQQVQQLRDANSAVMYVSLANIHSSTQLGEEALLSASQTFQASHELLVDLEHAVFNIPSWGVALASSSWTPRALEDLVAAAAAMYQACADAQAQQPLLTTRICALVSNLASALQQLAANSDAPGMKTGPGAELRSMTGGLCMQLRDLFMPAGG